MRDVHTCHGRCNVGRSSRDSVTTRYESIDRVQLGERDRKVNAKRIDISQARLRHRIHGCRDRHRSRGAAARREDRHENRHAGRAGHDQSLREREGFGESRTDRPAVTVLAEIDPLETLAQMAHQGRPDSALVVATGNKTPPERNRTRANPEPCHSCHPPTKAHSRRGYVRGRSSGSGTSCGGRPSLSDQLTKASPSRPTCSPAPPIATTTHASPPRLTS